MSKRNWTDQPEYLEAGEVLFHTYFSETHRSVEVRYVPSVKQGPSVAELTEHPGLYVSMGNLFGSETVKCDDYLTVFKVLQMAASNKKATSMPPGVELIASPKGDDKED